MRVTRIPICQPDIGELARTRGTVTVTLALCSAAPEGKQGTGGVEDGVPKGISFPIITANSLWLQCKLLALRPGPVHGGLPGEALQVTKERGIQKLSSGRGPRGGQNAVSFLAKPYLLLATFLPTILSSCSQPPPVSLRGHLCHPHHQAPSGQSSESSLDFVPLLTYSPQQS